MNTKIVEFYISVDIEAAGPIPGTHSMTALGAVLAGYRQANGSYVKLDPLAPENRFYVEIKPITDTFVTESMVVGQFINFQGQKAKDDLTGELRWQHIKEHGTEPVEAMTDFALWVDKQKTRLNSRGAIFAGYPLGFDWMWTYWYLSQYSVVDSPFGHSRHIDIKTLISQKLDKPIINSVKSRIPKALKSRLPHTHIAVDDAAEQGEILMKVLMI